MCPLAPKQAEFAPRQANLLEFCAQVPPSIKPKYGSKPCSPKDIVLLRQRSEEESQMRERASVRAKIEGKGVENFLRLYNDYI